MADWEYLIRGIMIPGPEAEDDLNDFGGEGWELVNYDSDACVCIFKRPKSNRKTCPYCNGTGMISGGPKKVNYSCERCDGLGVIDD